MKNLFLIVLCAALLPGCIGPKRYARYVNDVYNADYSVRNADPAIAIKSDVPVKFDTLVKVKKGQNYFIPAIFYWGVKETFECELNPRVPATIFSNECYRFIKETGLDTRLKGRRLEITLSSLPGQFRYSSVTDAYVVVFFYFIVSKQNVFPKLTNLSFTYKVYEGSTVVKNGEIVMESNEVPYSNPRATRKKITKAYLAKYEQRIKALAREGVDRLAAEL